MNSYDIMAFHDDDNFRLGALVYADGDAPEELLHRLVDTLRSDGVRLGGVVQHKEDVPGRRRCDMILEDLASGLNINISEHRGNAARGCSLDLSALANASELIRASLDAGVDLLVINKFGKTEAEGRGLLPVIAEAASRGVAVLIAVPEQNLATWRAFAADLACELPLDMSASLRWCRAAVGQTALEAAP